MSDTNVKTTAEAAREVGCTVWVLYDLIRNARIPTPVKVGKTYFWGEKDIANARENAGRKGVGK